MARRPQSDTPLVCLVLCVLVCYHIDLVWLSIFDLHLVVCRQQLKWSNLVGKLVTQQKKEKEQD